MMMPSSISSSSVRLATTFDTPCRPLFAEPKRRLLSSASFWTFAMVAQERAPDSELREALSGTVRVVCRDLTASGEWPGESLDPEFQAPSGDAVSQPGNAAGA